VGVVWVDEEVAGLDVPVDEEEWFVGDLDCQGQLDAGGNSRERTVWCVRPLLAHEVGTRLRFGVRAFDQAKPGPDGRRQGKRSQSQTGTYTRGISECDSTEVKENRI
jgi:hypothetical protein